MGVIYTCYPNFVQFTMDEFERHLYIYYFNCLKQSPRIKMNLESSSAYTVHGNDFLHKKFGHNAVRQKKEFNC